jgi:hypothetical protein
MISTEIDSEDTDWGNSILRIEDSFEVENEQIKELNISDGDLVNCMM